MKTHISSTLLVFGFILALAFADQSENRAVKVSVVGDPTATLVEDGDDFFVAGSDEEGHGNVTIKVEGQNGFELKKPTPVTSNAHQKAYAEDNAKVGYKAVKGTGTSEEVCEGNIFFLMPDLDLTGLEEDDEEDPGGHICYNGDNDDHTIQPDKIGDDLIDAELDDQRSVRNGMAVVDDELMELTLDIRNLTDAEWPASLKLRLRIESGSTKIRVWPTNHKAESLETDEDPVVGAKKSGVTTEKVWDSPSDMPGTLWLEAIDTGDSELRLEIIKGTTVIKDDQLMMHGIKVGLDIDANGTIDDLAAYLPGYDGDTPEIDDTHTQNMKLIVEGAGDGIDIEFTLQDTTSYEGFCGNAVATGFSNDDGDPDFILNSSAAGISDATDGNDTSGTVTKTAASFGNVSCWIRCRDYAGETVAHITIKSTPEITCTLSIPTNTDASALDHLPDAWENLYTVDLKDLDDDDEDFDKKHTEKGDGLSAFEEYRGFRILKPADDTKVHKRTNKMTDHTPAAGGGRNGGPLIKDLFVADTGDEPPFKNYGAPCKVYGISWHRVHHEDKGTANFDTTSGAVNTRTPAAMKIQDQFAILIRDKALGGSMGNAGEFWVNDAKPAYFDLDALHDRLLFFGITPAGDPAATKEAKEAVIGHEMGHRLTLYHLYDTFTLDANDVKAAGSAPQPGQQAILVDGTNKIQVRQPIQRRSDAGHEDHGFVTRIVDYDRDGVDFSETATDGILWTSNANRRTLQYDIPEADVTTVADDDPVEIADITWTFKNDVSALIADVKAGNKTATIKIWRGWTCLMDAKLVEQDHKLDLVSETPTNIDLYPRIQLKGSRSGLPGEHAPPEPEL